MPPKLGSLIKKTHSSSVPQDVISINLQQDKKMKQTKKVKIEKTTYFTTQSLNRANNLKMN